MNNEFEYLESFLVVLAIIVSLVSIVAKAMNKAHKKQVSQSVRQFRSAVKEAENRGQVFIPSVDQSMKEYYQSVPQEDVRMKSAEETPAEETEKAVEEHAVPSVREYRPRDTEETQVKSQNGFSLSAKDMRQAVIWSEILGKRGGRCR